MRQVLFRIPITRDGIPIYGFGMMLLAAFLSCIWLAKRRAAKVGIDRSVIEDLAIYLFGGGILGARICYLLVTPDALRGVNNPLDFLIRLVSIWDGGIIFYGAVIGGLLCYFIGYYFTFRFRKNVTTLRLADVVAPTIAVGLMLGRVGCFLNGCCFGQVACASCPGVGFPMSSPARYDLVAAGFQTPAGFLLQEKKPGEPDSAARVTQIEAGSEADVNGLKLGDLIVKVNGKDVERIKVAGQEVPSADSVAKLLTILWPRGEATLLLTVDRNGQEQELPAFEPRTLPLQPTQVYESISMILVLLLLLAFDALKWREGQVMALMMICYGLHRYVNETLRIDQRPAGFESYISILLFFSGIVMMVWLALRKKLLAASVPQA